MEDVTFNLDSPSNLFHSDQENIHFKLTGEPLNEYGVQHEFDSESLRVLEAVSEGNEDELLRLLDNGVDLRAVNSDGLTALHLAVVNDHELLAELLLKAPVPTRKVPVVTEASLYILRRS